MSNLTDNLPPGVRDRDIEPPIDREDERLAAEEDKWELERQER